MKNILYILSAFIVFMSFNLIASASPCSGKSDKNSCTTDSTCKWQDNESGGFCRTDCSKVGGTTFEDFDYSQYDDCTCKNGECTYKDTTSKSGNMYGILEDTVCETDSSMYQIEFKENKVCYKNNVGIYCSDKDETCVAILKSGVTYDSDLEIYTVPVAFDHTYWTSPFTTETQQVVRNLYTISDDPVVDTIGSWWTTIAKCEYDNVSTGTKDAAFFTDQIIAARGKDSSFLGVFPIESSKCVDYKAVNIYYKNKVDVCSAMVYRNRKINELATEYKNSNNAKYINEYKILVEELKGLCNSVVKNSDYTDACVRSCVTLSEDIYNWNQLFGIDDEKKCGFSARLIAWVVNIIKWIKYIIPVVVIVLGMLDFIKATGSDKDDDMKKAQGRFVKRLIVAALIFLVPLIFEFILPKLGFDYNSCDIF